MIRKCKAHAVKAPRKNYRRDPACCLESSVQVAGTVDWGKIGRTTSSLLARGLGPRRADVEGGLGPRFCAEAMQTCQRSKIRSVMCSSQFFT